MPSSFSKTFIASLLGGLIVAGCGGSSAGNSGGSSVSSGGSAAVATTFPLSTALANLYRTGFTKALSVSGTAIFNSNGATSKVPFSNAPLIVTKSPANAGSIFNGQAALKESTSLVGVFNINGIANNFSSVNDNFLSASNLLIGSTSPAPVSYCVASNAPGQYPDTTTIGQAQLVVAYDCYTDDSKATSVGTEKTSYLTNAGSSPGTMIFSILETFTDPNNEQIQFTEMDFEIDTSGNISFMSLSYNGLLQSGSGGVSHNIQLSFKSI